MAVEDKKIDPCTLAAEATTRNVQRIADMETQALSHRSPVDRIVDMITDFCGDLLFVWLHAGLFGAWVLLNSSLTPHAWHFDPFPYQLLTLVVSLEAIFLSTFILISQNRQGRIAERRSHLDLQINLRAEQQNIRVLALLTAMAGQMGVTGVAEDIESLGEDVAPDVIVQQIETFIEHHKRHA